MDWFESWFDTPYYHILYKNHDFQEAETFITKLTEFLKLPQHAYVIDLACGKGRHSVFLHQLGYNVLGLDLSQQSILHNQQFATAAGVTPKLEFSVQDMRNPMGEENADAVLNLFTSFGYFDDEKDDRSVFSSVNTALKDGGYFVLDYLNSQKVRQDLKENDVVEKEGIQFSISKKIENDFVIKDIQFQDDGKPYHFFEKVKLHTPEKILEYAKDAGFERIKIWGDYQLNDFNIDESPRCINLFRKINSSTK